MKVFISYRRSDSTYLVGRIRDRLMNVFGDHSVFRDLDDIPAGVDFRTVLEAETHSCNVMLVIIGPQWVGITDQHGNRRLLDPTDYTRIEVETGLRRLRTDSILVIPVLVMNASMPVAEEIPESLHPLLFQNAISLRNDPDFNNDMRRLIQDICKALGSDIAAGGEVRDPSSSLIDLAEQREILLDPLPAIGLFINREKPIKKMQSFLAEGSSRFVVLQGLPGIGKTALTVRFLQSVQDQCKAYFWLTCKSAQASPDILFSKLHVFFKGLGDSGLGDIARDPRVQLDIKINKLIQMLRQHPYLLVFDEFQHWLNNSQIQNDDLKQVLSVLLKADHRSKIVLISDKHPQFDPVMFRFPAGAKQEETLRGLDHTNAVRFLHQIGFKVKDRKLLHRIADYCDGNPHMMQIFCYFVDEMHRDPEELLDSQETATKYGELLGEVIEDLREESRNLLQFMSILRLPMERGQFQILGIRYGLVVGEMLDRFLVYEDPQSHKIHVSTAVRDYVLGSLSERNKSELHKRAAELYRQQRRAL